MSLYSLDRGTKSQSNQTPLACCGRKDLYHRYASDKLCNCHIIMNYNSNSNVYKTLLNLYHKELGQC